MGIENLKQRVARRGSLIWYLGVLPQRFREKRLGLLSSYIEYRRIGQANAKHLKGRILEPDHVTVLITSGGRKEYLEQTLESLNRYLEYDASKLRWYIIDDMPDSLETRRFIEELPGFDLKIFNPKNMGLGYSLNRIYVEVKTEFVFHCEDDWLFIRPIPIEKMIGILRENPHLRQLWLARALPPRKKPRVVHDTGKGFVEYKGKFGFVPHLGRMQLYIDHQPIPLDYAELEYTLKLERSGVWTTGILGYPDEHYVIHLGEMRTVVKY
ncbi:MAG: glycosyltransferase family 2 protein [Anaerolineae bacterium]|nr:glycosyltransferase family 2 protein [Anaerolineae bacterium]